MNAQRLSDPLPPFSPLRRVRQWIRWYIGSFGDVLFPPRCAGCGQVGTWLCDTCRSRFQPVVAPYCRRCGQPIEHGTLCAMCQRGRFHHLDMARSAAVFGSPLREVIHAFKYQGNVRLAEPLAEYMLGRLRVDALRVDAIVPVPLHPDRFRQRGYNQAALLARHLAKATGIPLGENMVVRVRHTPPQVTLGFRERMENMEGAFAAMNPARVAGHSFLLIDDVMTSGSTLEACAHALKDAGAERVLGYTLARATFQTGGDNINHGG